MGESIMELDKEYLKKLIQREMLSEVDRMNAAEFKKSQIAQATAQQTGLTDSERARLSNIIEKLKTLASRKDLGSSGTVTSLLDRLNDELDKALAG